MPSAHAKRVTEIRVYLDMVDRLQSPEEWAGMHFIAQKALAHLQQYPVSVQWEEIKPPVKEATDWLRELLKSPVSTPPKLEWPLVQQRVQEALRRVLLLWAGPAKKPR